MSILDIKKMVPVPSGYFEKINFNELEDIRYQDFVLEKNTHFA